MNEIALHLGVGSAAGFAAGLAGSVHCAVMCGPLAASVRGHTATSRPGGSRLTAVAWHVGRFGAYSVAGALLGAFGAGLTHLVAGHVHTVLPWVMALGLLLSGLELGRRLPNLPWLAAATRALGRLGDRLGSTGRALALGATTPLLPCGLLWGIFLAAAAAGGALGGAAIMVAFALGSTPGLAAVQAGIGWAGRFPRASQFLRRAVPIAAAIFLVVRALAAPATADLCH